MFFFIILALNDLLHTTPSGMNEVEQNLISTLNGSDKQMRTKATNEEIRRIEQELKTSSEERRKVISLVHESIGSNDLFQVHDDKNGRSHTLTASIYPALCS